MTENEQITAIMDVGAHAGREATLTMIRARRKVHLTRHFPKARVYAWKGRDYPFRVFVGRTEASEVIGRLVSSVSYPNFKNSVRDGELHDAYSSVWSVMHRYQHGAFKPKPYEPGLWKNGDYLGVKGWREPVRGNITVGETDEEWFKHARLRLPESETCGLLGCRPEQPCMDCLTKALKHENDRSLGAEPERYGDFDDRDDADARSSLRVAPR